MTSSVPRSRSLCWLEYGGGYRISERGGVRVTVKYQNATFLRARARRFFPLYEVWGSPKRGGS